MLREILTLHVNGIPMSYYIRFSKERNKFSFYPTLQHRSAPSFIINVHDKEILPPTDGVSPDLYHQACEKINEILGNSLFDGI